MRRPRPPCVRFWPQPIQVTGLVLGTVCTIGSIALDSLVVEGATVGWEGLRIGASREAVEAALPA